MPYRDVVKIRLTQDVPKYGRLNKGIVVEAEPVVDHPDVMRVKDFGAFDDGALARSWELVVSDEEDRGSPERGLVPGLFARHSRESGNSRQTIKFRMPLSAALPTST
jgi:hypothetical protein